MSFLDKILETAGSLVPDSLVARGACAYFNRNHSDIGTMTELQIDSANRRASVTLELKGETQAVHITINRYDLSASDGKTFVELKDVTTSREWLTASARQFLIGQKLEVPEFIRSLL